MSEIISPCPYCGNKITIESYNDDPPTQFTPECHNCGAGCWDFSSTWTSPEGVYHGPRDYFNTFDEALSAWNAFAERINNLQRPRVNIPEFLSRLKANNVQISFDSKLSVLLLKSKNHDALAAFHSFLGERPEYERTLLFQNRHNIHGLYSFIDEQDDFSLYARKYLYENVVPLFELEPEDMNVDMVEQKNYWLFWIDRLPRFYAYNRLKNLPDTVFFVLRHEKLCEDLRYNRIL